MKKYCTLLTALVITMVAATSVRAGLFEYVNRPDDSYTYKVHESFDFGQSTVYQINMTSQTWQGITWSHWLTLLVPKHVTHPDKAILIIGSGQNGGGPPSVNGDGTTEQVVKMLATTGAIVAYLGQVPNQPLFGGLREDGMIAMTFDKYLQGKGDDWPLLQPMVKSAVRAMDTISDFAGRQLDQKVAKFIVSGGSKRGWTTWLTGATDPRVCAIAPMVIDMLNLGKQMKHQMESYGKYSRRIQPYTDLKIPDRVNSDEGRQLLKIVDPYTYRDRLTMPKLVLLGTNDPYWTVDSSNFYFSDLPGPRHLYYLPNAGHGMGLGMVPTILAFVSASLNDTTLPKLDWTTTPDGSLQVKWDHALPLSQATLWQATSPARDFRKVTWTATTLEGRGQCTVKLDAPEKGWLAYFVQVRFVTPSGLPYAVSTTITVLPDTLPFARADATE